MFAIGDGKWPGISKLAEEAGEVLQVIGKLMGARGKVNHWDGSNLDQRLHDELADLLAAVDLVVELNSLDRDEIEHRRRRKLELFRRWHSEGDPPPGS